MTLVSGVSGFLVTGSYASIIGIPVGISVDAAGVSGQSTATGTANSVAFTATQTYYADSTASNKCGVIVGKAEGPNRGTIGDTGVRVIVAINISQMLQV